MNTFLARRSLPGRKPTSTAEMKGTNAMKISRKPILLPCLVLAILIVQFSGCAHYTVNQQIDQIDAIGNFRATSQQESDELLIVLAFSGGGTRAASLSYGVLEALEEVKIQGPTSEVDAQAGTNPLTLLDEVDVISSVSGGSVTAAYYGLYGKRIFEDFKDRFLYHNVNRDLFIQMLKPMNMVRLGSTYYARSDLAADYYDRLLFNGATFGDLRGKDTPALFIQATDIVDGIYFGFTPGYFSLICSDLDSFPISRAVAASAAFPGPFGAITLKNYAGTCGLEPPPWVTEALETRDTTSRVFYVASHMDAYLDSERKAYVHLVDGGVADNLALRGPLEAIIGRGGFHETLRKMGREKIRRIAFIVVNAEKDIQTGWGSSSAGPGILGILGITSSLMISSYNYETIELLRKNMAQWSAESLEGKGQPIDFYLIEVAFKTLHDEEKRKSFSRVSTSFNLPDETVNELIEISRDILYDSEDFQKLVGDIGGKIPSKEPQTVESEGADLD
jgi:NTE family protein